MSGPDAENASPSPEPSLRILALAGLLAAVGLGLAGSFRKPDPEVQRAAQAPVEAVPVNTATYADLLRIPGMTPRLARGILDLRSSLGKFERIEDLSKVPGMGPKTKAFERLKRYLQLSPRSAEE